MRKAHSKTRDWEEAAAIIIIIIIIITPTMDSGITKVPNSLNQLNKC
jgi:hypothetical protein